VIVLGLGSNLEDRIAYLRSTVEKLKLIFDEPVLISPVYESDPLVLEGANPEWKTLPFLNLAIRAHTTLSPELLLLKLKEIEVKIGRKTRERWAPREIDIDILAWGDLHHVSSELTLPHPALLERPFALLPLADVAPEWRYPVQGTNYKKTATAIATHWRGPLENIPFHTHRVDYAI
jgi:2-amino-4-hydroxy-6-hydroxymethyldihydropteridine diphosphokinase